MIVYIQKIIDGVWKTVLICDSFESSGIYTHLCIQYCSDKFRISPKNTNEPPPKLLGISREKALDILCTVKLNGLTTRQATKAFKKIVNVVNEMYVRYKR